MAHFEVDTRQENWVSTAILAKFLHLSDERVRQIEMQGVFDSRSEGRSKRFDLITCVNLYIEYLKKEAQSSRSQNDEQRKAKADADWKEAKAEIEQMKRDELKGALHSSDDVAEITTDLVMAVRAELLSLPGACAVDCADAQTAAEASGIIKEAVNNILNSLSRYEYDPAKYKALMKERETWIQNGKEEDD